MVIMNREVHKIYDAILRIIIFAYLPELLEYMGENRSVEEILKSDITTLDESTKYLDFLCRLKDGTLCHIEFQFPAAYCDDLERFFDYNITVEVRYGERTETIVLNFSTSTKGSHEVPLGYSKDFHPRIFYLGDIDFEKELEKIHLKLNLARLENLINNKEPNIPLTYKEELDIMLMSLPEKYKNKKGLIKEAVNLLKNEKLFHKEKIEIIRAVIKLEINNLLPEQERKEFEGAIKVTNETTRIVIDSFEYMNKKYEAEAFEDGKKEGLKEGLEEGKKEVAKKLKGIHTIEEISKITGLSISTILLL
jgi:hypothetical protein